MIINNSASASWGLRPDIFSHRPLTTAPIRNPAGRLPPLSHVRTPLLNPLRHCITYRNVAIRATAVGNINKYW